MCTAISLKNGGHCFGRTLDLECSYGEEMVITPRLFALPFRRAGQMDSHYAMIGIACVADGYPLYYDAANERGLCMAALNFPGCAQYHPSENGDGRICEVAPFEFIPWILGQCASVREAAEHLRRMRAVDIPFGASYPLTPLHWILADARQTLIVEPDAAGLSVCETPVHVLTNAPPYPIQLHNLYRYGALSATVPPNRFGGTVPFPEGGRGSGSFGLPGDFTSESRFVRAAFITANLEAETEETARIASFFQALDAVSVPRGCVRLANGAPMFTRYTSCWSAESSLYCCATYRNRCFGARKLREHDLDADILYRYPLESGEDGGEDYVPAST